MPNQFLHKINAFCNAARYLLKVWNWINYFLFKRPLSSNKN